MKSPALRVEWLGRMAYAPALARQESLVAAKIADPDGVPDTLLLLEHEPVYTIGRTPDRSSLLSPERLPHPVETIHRGGQATYHGPGQLVGYPILDLGRRGPRFARLPALSWSKLSSPRWLSARRPKARRRDGLTGVWVARIARSPPSAWACGGG